MKRNILLIFFSLIALTFSACKQGAIEPVQPTPIGDIRDYFWTSSSSLPTFYDSTGKTLDYLTLGTSSEGLLIQDKTVTNASNGNLLFRINRDSITGSGFFEGSLIDLDRYTFFTSLDSLIKVKPHITTAIQVGTFYCVATDIGILSNPNKVWNVDVALPNVPILAYDGSSYVYAVDKNGNFWQRSVSNNGWKPNALPNNIGLITALVSFSSRLYAATADGGLYWIYPNAGSTSWTLVKKFNSAPTLYATPDNQKMLIGTTDSVYYIPVGSSQAYLLNAIVGMGKIYSFLYLPLLSEFTIGTDSGIYIGGSSGFHHIGKKIPIESMAERRSRNGGSEQIAYISNHRIGLMDAVGTDIPMASNQPPPTVLKFIAGNSVVIVDTALMASDDYQGTNNWKESTDTLPALYPEARGGIVMLRSDKTIANDSWRAGTLVREASPNFFSYRFTGRLIGMIDDLKINGKSHPNVVAVRYAHEINAHGDVSTTDTLPSWTVYYQKGQGPIMFEKLKNGHLQRKMVNN